MKKNVAQFWDEKYLKRDYSITDNSGESYITNAALAYFQNIKGKTLLDLGCGLGQHSIFFARQGANVISADISKISIDKLSYNIKKSKIDNIEPILITKPFLGNVGKIDYIFGSMILHHLEPFSNFVDELETKLICKGFFFENNAMSRLLVWCRDHIVGKLWIPKYGDDEEFPLTPQEVDILRRKFIVEIEYPEMLFFQLASRYIFKGNFSLIAQKIDNTLYKIDSMKKYSYRQYVKIQKKT